MKKQVITLIILSLFIAGAKAQDNAVGIGLFGLMNRNLNLTFERKFSDKTSLKAGIGFMIPGKLPWLDISKNYMQDNETEGYLEIALDKLRISAISVTPEFRFYPGGSALKGFYLGPYLKYANYMFSSSYISDVDYVDNGLDYTQEDVVFELKGNVQKMGGGIMVGYQWIISEAVSIDWCLSGPGVVSAFASSTVEAPNFPASRHIGDFTEEELSNIPEVFGKIDVEQKSQTVAEGTWSRILPIYRFNISIGIAF
ncbi:MAG: DUF3575 domain-containing protein [Bacteroidota bacterium]